MTVVDVHTHYVPAGWPELPGVGPRPTLRVDSPRSATIMLGERPFRTVSDTAWNADVRLCDMAEHGVDRQVLSPTPVFFSYDQSGEAAAVSSAIFNDLALDIAAQAPGRLIPFCQVPLQDKDAACRELERAVGRGPCRWPGEERPFRVTPPHGLLEEDSAWAHRARPTGLL